MKPLTHLLLVFVCVLPTSGSFLSAQVWTLHGPQSRHSHTAVFDPTTKQMIIFGGQETSTDTDLSDVWLGVTSQNQDDRFTQLLPTGTAPKGRYGHVATYDPASNRMTIFGGAEGLSSPCANDVWILEGANGNGTASWTAEAPTGTAPAPRVYSAAAYDPTTDSMIVFGGNNCSTGYFNDVWVLTSANGEDGTPAWRQLTTSGTPPAARESASAVYDSVNNILTIYAGNAGSTELGDVWVLSNANGTGGTPVWAGLSPKGTAPGARTGQTAVYESAEDRMTIFGGVSGNVTLTDSWVLTAANGIGSPVWNEISTTGTAPSLAYHSAVYDPTANDMYVFAGSSTANKLSTNSHAFTLLAANGLSAKATKWILGGPAVRYSQSAYYDSVTNDLFVFGGQHSKTNLDFNDYWQAVDVIGSSNLKWNIIHANGPVPSPRFGHTGLYDSGSNRMMVFAGATGYPGPCVNDYHVLENANTQGGTPTWVTLKPSGTVPGIRELHASAYDSVTNTLMIFGGFNCGNSVYDDVWILQNANDVSALPSWKQLSPTGTGPSERESSSAVYDSTTNTLIVYGGDAGGVEFGDIWLLSNANGTGGTPAWTELTPSNQGPSARSGHTATYDSVNNLMTVYAGYNGSKILSDVWILSGANGHDGPATWSQGVSGQLRRFHTSEYVSSSNEMITFGGQTNLNPLNPNSDIYTLTDANGLMRPSDGSR
jgi:hypothetical protein